MKWLLPLVLATPAMSEPRCQAVVHLVDERFGFEQLRDAYHFCYERVIAWGLDRTEWQSKYCEVTAVGPFYNSRFRHRDKEYKRNFASSIFFAIEKDYAYRVYNNIELNIQIDFGASCKGGATPST